MVRGDVEVMVGLRPAAPQQPCSCLHWTTGLRQQRRPGCGWGNRAPGEQQWMAHNYGPT
jgi:hypothetical protein